MRPEQFEAFKRRMEAKGIRVTNTTPEGSGAKPAEGEEGKHEVIPFGSQRYREWYARRREEEEDRDE